MSRFLVFIAVVIAIIVGVHYYLWARLVREPQLAAPWRLLATWALPGPRPAEARTASAARDRLGLRLAIQAAAAVFIFVACTTFTINFYPVFAEALEESRGAACQAHLKTLSAAIGRFRPITCASR